ncbi:MAG: hypothetical protein MPL62_18080, partial [Alphaproteobacteria bacterium]|nr:hypothetical protein [Alphaproteobacteria bacterium]
LCYIHQSSILLVNLRITDFSLCTGRHCCLWCTITSQEMKIPLAVRETPAARTIHTLERDFHQFTAAGSMLKNAKFFYNVIQPYFFNIPLDQVNMPVWH